MYEGVTSAFSQFLKIEFLTQSRHTHAEHILNEQLTVICIFHSQKMFLKKFIRHANKHISIIDLKNDGHKNATSKEKLTFQ